jgi:hypothetical protein
VKQGLLRNSTIAASGLALLAFAPASDAQAPAAKADAPRSTIAQSLTPPALSQSRVDSALIEFPLPKGEEAYGAIDGRKMHKYVEELADISKRYRDAGHPKYDRHRERAGNQ